MPAWNFGDGVRVQMWDCTGGTNQQWRAGRRHDPHRERAVPGRRLGPVRRRCTRADRELLRQPCAGMGADAGR
ncbi:RICIN domain-containing protein [Cellulomonas soli]